MEPETVEMLSKFEKAIWPEMLPEEVWISTS